jgi:hypothetical protein
VSDRVFLGNCLFGAVLLMFVLRSWRFGTLWLWRYWAPPHFYVVARDGRLWHFGPVRGCCWWLLFWGQFRPMNQSVKK